MIIFLAVFFSVFFSPAEGELKECLCAAHTHTAQSVKAMSVEAPATLVPLLPSSIFFPIKSVFALPPYQVIPFYTRPSKTGEEKLTYILLQISSKATRLF